MELIPSIIGAEREARMTPLRGTVRRTPNTSRLKLVFECIPNVKNSRRVELEQKKPNQGATSEPLRLLNFFSN